VDPSRPGAKHQIDGLSGATYTTRGVDNLVKFWLGEDGYGPYLRKLKGS
jgi:Na+-transporting NADH:ubiquinone oxidoreductase subunit C